MALEKGTRSLCEISHLCNRAPSWTLALGSTLTRCVGQRVFTLRVAVSNSGAGRGIIPFALQALQLHATPANPSAHTIRATWLKLSFRWTVGVAPSSSFDVADAYTL